MNCHGWVINIIDITMCKIIVFHVMCATPSSLPVLQNSSVCYRLVGLVIGLNTRILNDERNDPMRNNQKRNLSMIWATNLHSLIISWYSSSESCFDMRIFKCLEILSYVTLRPEGSEFMSYKGSDWPNPPLQFVSFNMSRLSMNDVRQISSCRRLGGVIPPPPAMRPWVRCLSLTLLLKLPERRRLPDRVSSCRSFLSYW